jgi:hypothetical protein
MQAGKDDEFDTESKKKAIFSGFNFDMVNVGYNGINIAVLLAVNTMTTQLN